MSLNSVKIVLRKMNEARTLNVFITALVLILLPPLLPWSVSLNSDCVLYRMDKSCCSWRWEHWYFRECSLVLGYHHHPLPQRWQVCIIVFFARLLCYLWLIRSIFFLLADNYILMFSYYDTDSTIQSIMLTLAENIDAQEYSTKDGAWKPFHYNLERYNNAWSLIE